MTYGHLSTEDRSVILAELERGVDIKRLVERYDISKATLYRWRKKQLQSANEKAQQLKNVAEENVRLRNLLADAALEIQALKEKIG
ncbi:transposase [Sneathiella limimaris]|uniref:transposase n=1 Tax=Sneathiella limimaris TaxID=1964213 RepID=UPI00146F2D16|nr:transposase [Sneathiella limimaris]